ncbi:hypothetical protein [Peribacillus asahii]|uniref:hypothetical protein n=1 Tax=Peribacillus asahii TaxID=228899 RepID=UPI00382FCB07
MKFGQHYNGRGKLPSYIEYIQLDICGLSPIDIIQKYFLYEINKPIILLGDYTNASRNSTEDDMLKAERMYQIKDAIKSLQAFGAEIIGITFNPVSRDGLRSAFGDNISFKNYVNKLIDIYDIPVLIKNSNDKRLFLSTPEEVIDFTQTHKITLSIQELCESCNCSPSHFIDLLSKLNMKNIIETHVKHIDVDENGRPVNRWLESRNIELSKILKYTKNIKLITFINSLNENHPVFNNLVELMWEHLGNDSHE